MSRSVLVAVGVIVGSMLAVLSVWAAGPVALVVVALLSSAAALGAVRAGLGREPTPPRPRAAASWPLDPAVIGRDVAGRRAAGSLSGVARRIARAIRGDTTALGAALAAATTVAALAAAVRPSLWWVLAGSVAALAVWLASWVSGDASAEPSNG